MNCKPGDLAYIVKAVSNHADCIGRIVNVLARAREHGQWSVEFVGEKPLSVASRRMIVAEDAGLRPISGVPIDDETPVATNVPEALRLALGIESRWRA